jgi:hypothetical protein
MRWTTRAALEKAEKEKKPIMLMPRTATCVRCGARVLEKKVFTDPWIQHFMSPFVVVKEFENKKLMEEWKVTGFRRWCSQDSSGKRFTRLWGTAEPGVCGELAKAPEMPWISRLRRRCRS